MEYRVIETVDEPHELYADPGGNFQLQNVEIQSLNRKLHKNVTKKERQTRSNSISRSENFEYKKQTSLFNS